MPYIITATRYVPHLEPQSHEVLSRRAVATLDEAREAVHEIIGEVYSNPPLPLDAEWNTFHNHADCVLDGTSRIPVGPLPDGTMIEVTPVAWNWVIGVAEDLGIDTDAVYEDGGDIAILDAYNAQVTA